jgi:hypothetical protein
MTRRKGEITCSDLKRKWPRHVALPAEKVRDLNNSGAIFAPPVFLSATPLTYAAMTATSLHFSLRRRSRQTGRSVTRTVAIGLIEGLRSVYGRDAERPSGDPGRRKSARWNTGFR